MRSENNRFQAILAAYAVGALLLAGVCAEKIAGQQADGNAPTVRPIVNPIVMPEIGPLHIVVPDLRPIDAPELNFDLNANLNSELNSNLNAELNAELNRDLAPTIGATGTPMTSVAASEDDDDFHTTDEEKIQKSFAVPATGQKSLDIDNIFGSIEVSGDATDKIEMTVLRTNRAESKEKLEKAKKEVTLDISQDGGALSLYVNGPFRCHCDDCRHSRDDDGYVVKMDFQVHVPRDIEVHVKTVNEGHVRVRGTNGDFSVRNVNGDIEMDNISGSGTARTVNGPVKVSFRQNPRENSDFKTINGNVELKFTHDLSADFRFKTFNGAIYSDFPVTAEPVHPMQEEHHGAKVIYRADRYTEARVNAGGPQIQVENLNGEIRILENHE